MKRYICSDLHLGHRNIHLFRRQFKSAEDHDALVLENLKECQGKRNIIFFLGDVAFSKDKLEEIKNLTFDKKVLILGNHDTENRINIKDLADVYDEIHSLYSYKNNWLVHAPIVKSEIRSKDFVIHGHIHPNLVLDEVGDPDPFYRNVCLEYTNYAPVEFDEVLSLEYYKKCVALHKQYRYQF